MNKTNKKEVNEAAIRTAHLLLKEALNPDKREIVYIAWEREDLEDIAFDVGAMLCSEELPPPFMVEGEVPSEESVQACTDHLFKWFDKLDIYNDPPSWSNFREEAENFYNSLLPKEEEEEEDGLTKNTTITSYLCNDCGMAFYIDSFDLEYCPNCGSSRALVEQEIGMKDYDYISKCVEAEKGKLESSDDFYINKETGEHELDFMFGEIRE